MSVFDNMRSHFDAVSEDSTVSEDGTVPQHGTVSEVFDDGTAATEAIEEIEYVDDEELNHKTLELYLLSARVDRYKNGMHPEAIRAETVHYASAIPPYPISSDKGYAYVIDTTRIDEADVKEPYSTSSSVRPGKRAKTVLEDAHERALDAQITVDEMKDEVQELRTAVPTQIAAQEALTAAHLAAQSQLIAKLNESLQAANGEGDHEFRDQIKRRILEVISTPAASISAVAPADDPAALPAVKFAGNPASSSAIRTASSSLA
ncbi:hypothetical protein E4U40_000509, partial [Claviceps sp. LM458 group G5]